MDFPILLVGESQLFYLIKKMWRKKWIIFRLQNVA